MSLHVARRPVIPKPDTDTEQKEIGTLFVKPRLIVELIMGSVKGTSQVAGVDGNKNLTISFEGSSFSHSLFLSLPLEEHACQLAVGTDPSRLSRAQHCAV